jgi:hypothetical protein
MTLWGFSPIISQVFIAVITGCISSIGGWKFVLTGIHHVSEINEIDITQILAQPQDIYASNCDIVSSSTMESFSMDMKDCLQSGDSQANVEDYLYSKGNDNLPYK